MNFILQQGLNLTIRKPAPSESRLNWKFNPHGDTKESQNFACEHMCYRTVYPWNELVKVSLSKITCHAPQTQTPTHKRIHTLTEDSVEWASDWVRGIESFSSKYEKKYRSNFRTVLWLLIDSISFWMLSVCRISCDIFLSSIIIINISIIVFVVVDIFFLLLLVFSTRGIKLDMAYDITSKTIFVLLNRQIKESVCQ